MPPREEDQENLAQDVGGGDVEVVFQSWNGDVAVYLRPQISKSSWTRRRPKKNLRFVPCTPGQP